MLSFYGFPESVRVAFSMLTVLGAGTAALVLVLHQYRLKRGFNYWLESSLAFLVLCQTVVNAALVAWVQYNVAEGFFTQGGYTVSRYAIFTAVTTVATLLFIRRIKHSHKKALIPCIAAAASFMTLPFMETWTNRLFPVFFSSALLLLLISGVVITVKIYGELMTSISSLSIKQAMDSLADAVLFYGKSGHILMQNEKMQELMVATAGRVFYNGRTYLETVVIQDAEYRNEDSYLYRIGANGRHGDSVWLFSVSKITLSKKNVTRIIATDVTEQDKAAILLRNMHDELEQRRERLGALVKSIEKICRAEELLRVKNEIHDEQNKRMIPLLQYLRYNELPDGVTFNSLSADILRSIRKTGENAPVDPKAMLDAVLNQYSRMGVEIYIDGAFPPKQEISAAFVQILIEAAANAVRHGYANVINMTMMDDGCCVTMQITDNSPLPPREIKEGSGIAGMRRHAEKLGGSLEIFTIPRFTLTAIIPMRSEGI